MKFKQLILITGVERSGSTLISRVLESCGANAGVTNKMRENASLRVLTDSYLKTMTINHGIPNFNEISIPKDWKEIVIQSLKGDDISEAKPFLFKYFGIAQMWPVWHDSYPNAKWIIVRRRTGDILYSLNATTYMSRFKSKVDYEAIGASSEKEAWLLWIHCYERLFAEITNVSNLDCKVVWPERMRDSNFEQIKEVVAWCGLEWNDEIPNMMKLLLKSK